MLLIRPTVVEPFEDKTGQAESWFREGERLHVVFANRPETDYSYSPARAVVLHAPAQIALGYDTWVEVDGTRWADVKEALLFRGPDGDRIRLFALRQQEERTYSYSAEHVRFLKDAAKTPAGAAVLEYWRRIVAHLPDGPGGPDPLRRAFASLDGVHPESVLGHYLNGSEISEDLDPDLVPIFPFFSNLSQREAVKTALRFPISVIEGPPGTGKTQTVLNLISTLIAAPGRSVGVVSFNNAAVDNVRDKMIDAGFGYVLAGLGRREKRLAFFADQARREGELETLRSGTEVASDPDRLQEVGQRLDRHQHDERELQRLRGLLGAMKLERRHFLKFIDADQLPERGGLLVLERTSERILEFLAETTLPEEQSRLGRWLRRIRWLIRYGAMRNLDISRTEVILQLYRAYYDRKIEELERDIQRLDERLLGNDLHGLLELHRKLSIAHLRTALRERYSARPSIQYDPGTYRRWMNEFLDDYPVILSTCHSLRGSLDSGRLLDYLIVDEASQLDLPTAALALASCRRVIVVGDLKQLPHLPNQLAAAQAGPAPSSGVDYVAQNVLSSFHTLYGKSLPRTVLREHYRCDPAIIGFCNQKFYGGELIPFSVPPLDGAMELHPTVPGNHMRQFRQGGKVNRREIEVIRSEVIPQLSREFTPDQIGLTTPYRKQANEAVDALIEELSEIEADTVHRYQGREKPAIVMTTVLDETWRGQQGLRFVDDPRLINVAVSRAMKKFVLVIDSQLLPASRHIRDLVGYIRYQNLFRELPESEVISIFDLLYQRRSHKLRELSARVRGPSNYPSENIAWTVVSEVLAESAYHGLAVTQQVLLRTLIPNLDSLTVDQVSYVQHRASLDLMIYNLVTKQPVLAIEVDGFAFHDDKPEQLRRDRLKNEILNGQRISLLRLSTTGDSEPERIRRALDVALSEAGT